MGVDERGDSRVTTLEGTAEGVVCLFGPTHRILCKDVTLLSWSELLTWSEGETRANSYTAMGYSSKKTNKSMLSVTQNAGLCVIVLMFLQLVAWSFCDETQTSSDICWPQLQLLCASVFGSEEVYMSKEALTKPSHVSCAWFVTAPVDGFRFPVCDVTNNEGSSSESNPTAWSFAVERYITVVRSCVRVTTISDFHHIRLDGKAASDDRGRWACVQILLLILSYLSHNK